VTVAGSALAATATTGGSAIEKDALVTSLGTHPEWNALALTIADLSIFTDPSSAGDSENGVGSVPSSVNLTSAAPARVVTKADCGPRNLPPAGTIIGGEALKSYRSCTISLAVHPARKPRADSNDGPEMTIGVDATGESSVGSDPSSVKWMTAPIVVVLKVTDSGSEYTPPAKSADGAETEFSSACESFL
jgi:hypothetical protein